MSLPGLNLDPTPREIRKFGLTIVVGLGIIGAVLWYVGAAPESRIVRRASGWQWTAVAFWFVGVVVFLLAWASPRAARPVYVVWMTAAFALGMVMTPVFLSVLFITLLPVFTLIRFADPLRKRLGGAGSYWEDHAPHPATMERTRRPF